MQLPRTVAGNSEILVVTNPRINSAISALLAFGVMLAGAGCNHISRHNQQAGERQGLTVVEDGENRAVIVAATGESHAQQAAAAIQNYVEKISGATIPVFEEGQEQPAAAARVTLYIGHTEAAKNAGIDIPAGHDPTIRADAFEEEGYVLKTVGNDIFIGGNSDGSYRGTIYGAYAFLEKLGCRWYFPGEWGEIVPKRETVTVPHLDVLSRPDCAIRRIGMGRWVKATPEQRNLYETDWCDKIGFNGGQFESYPGVGDGYLGRLLPFSEYYETQARFHEGSASWNTWNAQFSPTLITNQDVEPGKYTWNGEAHDVGFWVSPSAGEAYGKVYSTTLCAMMLQVYYRYLPTFALPATEQNAPVTASKSRTFAGTDTAKSVNSVE